MLCPRRKHAQFSVDLPNFESDPKVPVHLHLALAPFELLSRHNSSLPSPAGNLSSLTIPHMGSSICLRRADNTDFTAGPLVTTAHPDSLPGPEDTTYLLSAGHAVLEGRHGTFQAGTDSSAAASSLPIIFPSIKSATSTLTKLLTTFMVERTRLDSWKTKRITLQSQNKDTQLQDTNISHSLLEVQEIVPKVALAYVLAGKPILEDAAIDNAMKTFIEEHSDAIDDAAHSPATFARVDVAELGFAASADSDLNAALSSSMRPNSLGFLDYSLSTLEDPSSFRQRLYFESVPGTLTEDDTVLATSFMSGGDASYKPYASEPLEPVGYAIPNALFITTDSSIDGTDSTTKQGQYTRTTELCISSFPKDRYPFARPGTSGAVVYKVRR